jgi:hypothetical protein
VSNGYTVDAHRGRQVSVPIATCDAVPALAETELKR